MTKQQVHNLFCNLSEEAKTNYALKYSKEELEKFEENIAFLITLQTESVQKSMDYLNTKL